MFKLEVTDNGEGGHRDIVFSINGLLEESYFDSYWLIVGTDVETFQDTRNAVANLLAKWEKQILSSPKNSNPYYLPIDISDQYVGCIRVEKHHNHLHLTYGFTDQCGFSDFLDKVTDFIDTENQILKVTPEDLLETIRSHIYKLKNFS